MHYAPLVIRDVPGDDDIRELVALSEPQQTIAKINLADLGRLVTSPMFSDGWKQQISKDVLWEAAYYGIMLHPETILDKMDEIIREAIQWN